MPSSDFLLIVPEGWFEVLDMDSFMVLTSPDDIQRNCSIANWPEIEQVLEQLNLVPPNTYVSAARLLQTSEGYRFWVQFTQQPAQ